MKGSLSPIVQRCAGEVVHKPKRSFSSPTEVCLEDWWLSKPDSGKGIAVSGIPFELRRCNHARKEVHSAPTKKRYSLREFHSSEIVKRHGCTTVETSDGLFVSLCGFINRSRTCQNGFSSEVCRDFIYGFPFNWEVSAAQCVGEDSSQTDGEYISKHFLPPALDVYNGAQLHDLVLSLTDGEREAFNKTMYDNVMGVLSSETVDEINVQPSKSDPSSLVDADIQPMTKPSIKRRRSTLKADYTEEEREIASVSPCTIPEKWPHSTERNNVEGKEDFVRELQPCQKPGMDVTTSRKRVCTSVTKDTNSGTEPQTPDSAQRKIVVEESTAAQQKLVWEESTAAQQKIVVEESTEMESAEMGGIIAGQSEVRRWLKHLTSAGINLSGQGRRLCHELKNLLY